MTEFNQNIESKRFLKVLDHLIDKQIVKNDADFCKSVGYSPQSFSQVRKGKRDVTTELISKLFTVYQGNPIFIFSESGPLLYKQQENYAMVAEHGEKYPTAKREREHEELLKELIQQNIRMEKLVESYANQATVSVKYTKVLEEQLEQFKQRIKELEHGQQKSNR